MSSIQIITDSTAYFTREEAKRRNIDIIPLSIDFAGEVSNEGFPGEFEEFFDKLKVSEEFPTTSQPSTDAFITAYERAIQEDKEIIAIVISSKLSGTYNNASLAASMVSPDKISVIDSETTVSNLRFLTEMAQELAEDGKSRQEIVDIINIEKLKSGVRLTVETLDYLKKGGRLTATQALIGSMLNIKPIIALTDGQLVPVGKARGKKKALKMMMASIPEGVKKMSICHISALEEAMELKEILQEEFENSFISIDDLGPVIGAHLGAKAMGICYKW